MKTQLLTIVLLAACLGTVQGQVPHVIAYQGGVVVNGTNFQGTGHFKFALVSPDGTSTYWSNDGTGTNGGEPQKAVAIPVVDGLYDAPLGDAALGMPPIAPSIFENSDVRVRVWFSNGGAFGQLQPDTQITAVGYAMLAASVADGAITTPKIARNAITAATIADNAVTATKIAPNSITAANLTSGSIVLSDQSNATNLIGAGFQKIGSFTVDGDQWQTLSRFIPSPRYNHVALWTGQEMLVFGGMMFEGSNTGARYNPTTDLWTVVTNRLSLTANLWKGVWTGSEAIFLGDFNEVNTTSHIGAAYRPTTDTWRRISMNSGPTNITSSTLVWTGTELLVWGGGAEGSGTPLNSGARYNPATDTWKSLTALQAPSRRYGHAAVWTGSEMLVWGGYANLSILFKDTGAAYNPTTDSWRSLPTAGQPPPGLRPLAAWTGTEMIVYGGQDPQNGLVDFNSGGRLDPASGTWRALPSKQSLEPLAGVPSRHRFLVRYQPFPSARCPLSPFRVLDRDRDGHLGRAHGHWPRCLLGYPGQYRRSL